MAPLSVFMMSVASYTNRVYYWFPFHCLHFCCSVYLAVIISLVSLAFWLGIYITLFTVYHLILSQSNFMALNGYDKPLGNYLFSDEKNHSTFCSASTAIFRVH